MANGTVVISGKFQKSADFDLFGIATFATVGRKAEMFLARYDTDGSFQGLTQIKGRGYFQGLDTDSDGNIVVNGIMSRSLLFDPNGASLELLRPRSAGSDGFVARFDPNGNFNWV